MNDPWNASFESMIDTMREADISTAAAAVASTTEELGDKRNFRKTLVRHIVKRVESDFPGRQFADLAILEIGAGAGFFAMGYAEVFPHLPPLKNMMQIDKNPVGDSGAIAQLDIAELWQEDNPLATVKFDVVMSIDVLSCLAFGRGLDPEDEDDVDEMSYLDQALARLLMTGGKYYDFMACAPNTQFIMRFVPDYAQLDQFQACRRFIMVCDPGHYGQEKQENEPLMFVTFNASLLQHAGADAAGGPLLQVAGHERPLSYDELSQRLGLLEAHKAVIGAPAFIKKVLDFLFRDINAGGCPSNWELMTFVYVDSAHWGDVFEEPEAMIPVFMDTIAKTVQFLRESFKASESYQEISLINAFRSATAANLPSLSVGHVEEDIVGTRGDCFKQFYHYSHVYDGKGGANGEGSFRYLLTTATAVAQPTLNSLGGGSSMMID